MGIPFALCEFQLRAWGFFVGCFGLAGVNPGDVDLHRGGNDRVTRSLSRRFIHNSALLCEFSVLRSRKLLTNGCVDPGMRIATCMGSNHPP